MMSNLLKNLRFLTLLGCVACSDAGATMMDATEEDYDTDVVSDFWTPVDFYRQCTGGDCNFNAKPGSAIIYDVPTWHARDTGFRLDGAPAVIAVTDEYAAHPDVDVACYAVQLLGYWTASSGISLEILGTYGVFGLSVSEEWDTDYLLDTDVTGEFEWNHRFGASDWELHQFEIRTLTHRGKLEFGLRQDGDGDAVFYFLEVNGSNTCSEQAVRVDGAP